MTKLHKPKLEVAPTSVAATNAIPPDVREVIGIALEEECIAGREICNQADIAQMQSLAAALPYGRKRLLSHELRVLSRA